MRIVFFYYFGHSSLGVVVDSVCNTMVLYTKQIWLQFSLNIQMYEFEHVNVCACVYGWKLNEF